MDSITLTRQQILDWIKENNDSIEENKENARADKSENDSEGWQFYMDDNKKLHGENDALRQLLNMMDTSDGKKQQENISSCIINSVSHCAFQLCPKCNGQGTMSKPPHIPGDVNEWTSSQTSFTCDVCNGEKILKTHSG